MLLLIKGKLLIDGTGTPPIPDGAILVEGGRIVEVGKLKNLHFPSDTRIINPCNRKDRMR
jgi:cytosine/adenosine deaminase-related metal-dependent hydrolase